MRKKTRLAAVPFTVILIVIGGESMCTYLEVISMTFSGFLLGVALCNFIYVRDLFPKQRESRDNDVGNRSNKHED